ncbi:MAG TPA: TetR/AcrR family transcriptional regulator C-terminal domain-containing protein [Solirubrobacteraceae bacterium]|nr:TetR/AcrR family transcriptional regulator C-terminal domain-containing protein [Solirubrobacteraceae bacterium]
MAISLSCDEDDPDSEFEFGLERILDGVAALIARA